MKHVDLSDLSRRRGSFGIATDPWVPEVLDALHREAVTPPAAAVRALQLADELRARSQSPNVGTYVAEVDLDSLTPESLWAYCRTALTDTELTDGRTGSNLRSNAADALTTRAAKAIIADIDRIIADLRPRWDAAAAVVHAAAQTGITSINLPAKAVIDLGDDAVRAWRDMAAPLATLNRIWQLRNLLALHAGREIPETDLGTVDWLARANSGAPELTITAQSWQSARVQRATGARITERDTDPDDIDDIEAQLTKEQVTA